MNISDLEDYQDISNGKFITLTSIKNTYQIENQIFISEENRNLITLMTFI